MSRHLASLHSFAQCEIPTLPRLNDSSYRINTRAKINDWSNSIISAALKGLQSLNRPYKYAITVIVMQKNGAGLVSAASTYWDTSKDGLCKVVWENGTMHCVVTVYGTCVNIDPEDAERQDAAVSFATTIP